MKNVSNMVTKVKKYKVLTAPKKRTISGEMQHIQRKPEIVDDEKSGSHHKVCRL